MEQLYDRIGVQFEKKQLGQMPYKKGKETDRTDNWPRDMECGKMKFEYCNHDVKGCNENLTDRMVSW